MTKQTDQRRPTDQPRRRAWLRLGRLVGRNADRPTRPDRPQTADRRPAGDRPTADRRPQTDQHPQTDRRSATVDQRARRAQLTAQAGAAGLPTGYRLVFGVLVAGSVTAGLVSFLFSFGNVRWLNIWLGLPGWIQPLVSPAVDLSVIVLVVVIQYLTLAGAPKQMLRSANVFLLGAGLAMLGANVAPSLIMGLAASDQSDAGRLYGRAAVEAFAPGALVCWAHVGPALVRAFAWVRNRADQAALAVVTLRTLATEEDRATAAADRSAAAALLNQARADADRIRQDADQLRADADRTREKIADQAAADQRHRAAVEQEAVDRADQIRRDAERDARRLTDQAAADRAAAAQAAQALADRERALTDRRREIEAEADKAAADRRAAAELLAEAETAVPAAAPTARRPATLHAVQATPAGRADRPARANRNGASRDELAKKRAAKAKEAFPDWTNKTPSKRALMEALSIHGEGALDVAKLLREERLASDGEQTA